MIGQRREDDVGQCLGNRHDGTGRRINQGDLRRVTDGGRDTCLATVVEGNSAQVAQRQLQLALALLAGDLTRDGAVYLVGQPILAGDGLQLEHVLQVVVQLRLFINNRLISLLDRVVAHDRARWLTEHIFQLDVDRLDAIGLLEDELHVVGRLAYDVHRGALAVGDAFYPRHVLLLEQQAHALLALVADDLLGGERRVADRQLAHVDVAACRLNQLGEAVQVTARAVVVDRDDWVVVALGDRADHVGGAFLHLWVGTLYGVQLDAARVLSGVDG